MTAAPGWGEPEGDFVGKHTMLVPGTLICRSLISQLSRRRERRIQYLSASGLCVHACSVLMCLWLSGDIRGGLSRELCRPLPLLSVLCVSFRFLPRLLEPGHRRLAPASLTLVALECDRSQWGPRRRGSLAIRGIGAIPRSGSRARVRPPAMAAGLHRPLQQAHAARPRSPPPRPLSRRCRAHVGARPMRISRLLDSFCSFSFSSSSFP